MNTTIAVPRGCTNFKTRQLARVLSRLYDSELAKVGLKTTQFSLLSHVLTHGPIAPGELARLMGLDASTLTRNLRPLVEAGWLLQDAGADARTRVVTITFAGRQRQVEAKQCWKAAQKNINAVLGIERVSALHGLVDECLAQLQSNEAEQP